MKYILNLGMVAMAAGFMFITADTAFGQNRGAVREYRRDVREARRDYRRDVRRGENPYKARREYYNEVRDAQREYYQNVTRGRTGWYYYQNGRRQFRPFSMWNYRNGYFYRRY